MAARLESAAKSPLLGLLLKSFVVIFGAFWLRRTGLEIGPIFLFIFLFLFIYFQPPFNSRKFLLSALVLLALPILAPPIGGRLELILLFLWGVTFTLLLGAKNLLLIRRQASYELLHLLIIIALGALFLIGFIPQLILFLLFFLLFREFYFVLAPHYPQRLTLVAAAEALLLLEIVWILSFVSVDFLTGAALLTLLTFIFHDLILHHLKGALSRELILRNTTLFVALSVILFLLPR